MTPAALKCQLIAVELCNLETTVFCNPLWFLMTHPAVSLSKRIDAIFFQMLS